MTTEGCAKFDYIWVFVLHTRSSRDVLTLLVNQHIDTGSESNLVPRVFSLLYFLEVEKRPWERGWSESTFFKLSYNLRDAWPKEESSCSQV